MTVAELRALLETYDPADLVVLTKDGTGNEYSSSVELIRGYYHRQTAWSGEFYDAGGIWTPDDGVPAVCLETTN